MDSLLIIYYLYYDQSLKVLIAKRAHSSSEPSSGAFKTPLGIVSKSTDNLLTNCKIALGYKIEKVR
jgi:hypothetical protein